jgi:hypothetical protein
MAETYILVQKVLFDVSNGRLFEIKEKENIAQCKNVFIQVAKC